MVGYKWTVTKRDHFGTMKITDAFKKQSNTKATLAITDGTSIPLRHEPSGPSRSHTNSGSTNSSALNALPSIAKRYPHILPNPPQRPRLDNSKLPAQTENLASTGGVLRSSISLHEVLQVSADVNTSSRSAASNASADLLPQDIIESYHRPGCPCVGCGRASIIGSVLDTNPSRIEDANSIPSCAQPTTLEKDSLPKIMPGRLHGHDCRFPSCESDSNDEDALPASVVRNRLSRVDTLSSTVPLSDDSQLKRQHKQQGTATDAHGGHNIGTPSKSFTIHDENPFKRHQRQRPDETLQEGALIDNLTEKYEDLNLHYRDHARCMIKYVFLNPYKMESMIAAAFAELDSFADESGCGEMKSHNDEESRHAGRTSAKLAASRNGVEVSIRENQCLVRCAHPGTSLRDYSSISINCPDCKEQHLWSFQRGWLHAALIGRYDHEVQDEEYPIAHLFLTKRTASHTCHNSMCSDPFHIEHEDAVTNGKRNRCVRGQPCNHVPRCRLKSKWSTVGQWEVVYAMCIAAQRKVLTPMWLCTKRCWSRRRIEFTTLSHWEKGCPRQGSWVRC